MWFCRYVKRKEEAVGEHFLDSATKAKRDVQVME